MKRFEFPLERVRRWRSEQVSVEELKLQQLRAQLDALAIGKQQIRDELARVHQDLLGRSEIQALELETLDSYRYHVQARVRNFEQRELQCEAKIIEQRAKLLEARRRFELLDGLKQKALTEWRAAADKEQEDLAAELFLAKSIRNRHGSRISLRKADEQCCP